MLRQAGHADISVECGYAPSDDSLDLASANMAARSHAGCLSVARLKDTFRRRGHQGISCGRQDIKVTVLMRGHQGISLGAMASPYLF